MGSYTYRTAVIGAAGRIGLTFSLVLAEAGHRVLGIDRNREAVDIIGAGMMPFHEEGAQQALDNAIRNGRFSISCDLSDVQRAEYVVVLVGADDPDALSPYMIGLDALVDDLVPYLEPGHVLVIRSTVAPGTTDALRARLLQHPDLCAGQGIVLANVPERSLEGRGMSEMVVLPSIIGAYCQADFDRLAQFCASYSSGACIQVTPREAEFAKIITNVARYVHFSLSNEIAMVGRQHDVNVNRVIDAANLDYPRLGLHSPGSNVGGPCLTKDSRMFVDSDSLRSPLVRAALDINSNMLSYIASGIAQYCGAGSRVAVLGLTFKRGSDDMRGSLAPLLCEELESCGHRVVRVEPNLAGFDDFSDLLDSDAVILMTPHAEFKDRITIADRVGNADCLYVDLWGEWEDVKYLSRGGFWKEHWR